MPTPFLIRADAPEAHEALATYLRDRGWIDRDDAVVSAAAAGDGNMNCTLRVITRRTQLIVKQGRPWVEKYPDIPAPPDRTLVEAAFYAHVAATRDVAAHMPAFIGLDHAARVLVLADCVGFRDATFVYDGDALGAAHVTALLNYLAALHRGPVSDATAPPFANAAMRALNHTYIYAQPLAADAAFHARLDSLTPGLAAIAATLAADVPYANAVTRLGHEYLDGPGRALLHGDFFPGSWLVHDADVVVIDPEFCFAGPPEFDYGVMAAHVLLAGHDDALAARMATAAVARGHSRALVDGFAGVEVMRRLIGVAQLPRLTRTLDVKHALLERSRRLVLGGESLCA